MAIFVKKIILVIAVVLLFSTGGFVSATYYNRLIINKIGGNLYCDGAKNAPNPETIAHLSDVYEDEYWGIGLCWGNSQTETFHSITVYNANPKFQFVEYYPCDQMYIRYVVLNQTFSMTCQDRDSGGHPLWNNNKWATVTLFIPSGYCGYKMAVIGHGLLPSTNYSIVMPATNKLVGIKDCKTTASGTFSSTFAPGFYFPFDAQGGYAPRNSAYRHPDGAAIWVLPSAYVKPINDASQGHDRLICPSNVNKNNILFETDYMADFPPIGRVDFNMEPIFVNKEVLQTYGRTIAPGQTFTLPIGISPLVIFYQILPGRGLPFCQTGIWSRLDALLPVT